ncbi:MAG TPA: helix-turn-helix transcriptional regulator [Mucilaginibacter sp.]|nr:helix-turn-helix transcriptional regulator [Mucilaginibacter sp.]
MKNGRNVLAKKIFSEQLKAVREEKKMTQHGLATVSNVNRSQIGEFERGVANPTLDSLVELASALDVNLDDLMPMSRYNNERATG